MKILTLSFFLVLCSLLYSQGNLQFNQVLSFEPGDNYTIPTGKCLKIESINMNSTTVCIPKSNTGNGSCATPSGYYPSSFGIYAAITFLTLGNMNFQTPTFNGNQGTSCSGWINTACYNYNFGALSFETPIWLEAGQAIVVNPNVSNILISAIEFNIVP
jgi:hypothetical protein